MRPSTCATGFAGVLLLAACAHHQPNQSEIDRLNRSIEGLRVQNVDYAKQVEELENRLFILTDQLESRKVNEEKIAAPTLPTVTLHPEAAPSPPEQPLAPLVPLAPAGTETASEPEVEYVGEAAKSNVHRPVLRLHGDTAEIQITREPAAPTIRLAREGGAKPGKSDSPDAVTLYRKAFEALRAGRHEEAERGFREFVRAYPSHDLADNSQYWLGECFYDRKDYAAAVHEFRKVIERYPSGNKVPDALLKVGFSYLLLGSTEAGRQTLSQLQRSYPRHEAAGLATTRLEELDRDVSHGEDRGRGAATARAAQNRMEAP
jgi:tol-pal system protein YbgF